MVAAMSDWVLSIVPTDHLWTPQGPDAERARAVLSRFEPTQSEVTSEFPGRVMAYDTGQNWETDTLTCPDCGHRLADDWFGDEVVRAADTSDLRSLEVTSPCCARVVSLNAIAGRHRWPMAFASFSLQIWNPEAEWVWREVPLASDNQLEEVGNALGHTVVRILAHY